MRLRLAAILVGLTATALVYCCQESWATILKCDDAQECDAQKDVRKELFDEQGNARRRREEDVKAQDPNLLKET